MFRASLLLLVVGILNGAPADPGLRIEGRVIDQSGLPLPGVSLRLSTGTAGPAHTAVTKGDGTYGFEVTAGDYRLDAELDGFQRLSIDIRATAPVAVPDLVMNLASFSSETTVVAGSPTEVQPPQFGAPATIAAQVIDNAPRRTNRYDDVLPLVPNVVRGPDGLISVAGSRAPQGILLLNGVPSSDVASGDPLAAVPLGAVQTVQVITTGFAAEFGPSTGGVTIVTSRPGGDVLSFTVNSFIPRPRLADGGVKGIEAWTPNTSVRGPIVKGRAWFAQSFDYNFEKTRADTVAGAQDRRQHGFTSFTQIDVRTTPSHLLTAWVNGRTEHADGERLGAFTPLGTVPDVERRAWSTATIDRAAFANSTLETRIDLRHQDTALSPDGDGGYVVGHDITRGAYFGTVDRHALSVEGSTVLSHVSIGWHGAHLFKTGASVGHRRLDGLERNQIVTYLRSSLVPARIVEFLGPGLYEAASTRIGVFAQDGWDMSAGVRLDLGIRLDHDTRAGTVAAPRAGLTWSRKRTTVSAGAGWFASDTPLAAQAFGGYQVRRVTYFDEAGVAQGPSTTYRNAGSGDPGLARALIWSARIDQRLGAGWQLRAGVQERRGTHETIVSPAVFRGENVALLSATGESRTRSFEATLGYHPAERQHQIYVSYVRSSSEGNTNDFGQLEGLFKDPRLEAAEMAPLPADVPHRLLVWGLFSLPRRVTVAPFLEFRSGFPYSAIDDSWSYSGPRFSRRYPAFASLDLVVNKVVTLPGGARARVGAKLYNIAGRRNGRDVQADITRHDVGQTYNALGRQVRGVFEIMWN